MMKEVIDVEATYVEPEECEGECSTDLHEGNGDTVRVPAWNRMQMLQVLLFTRDLLQRDLQFQETPATAPLLASEAEAYGLLTAVIEENPSSIPRSPHCRALGNNAIIDELVHDLVSRLGELFGQMCKKEHVAVDDMSRAMDAYRGSLVRHVQALRRIFHAYTKDFLHVVDVLSLIHSRVNGGGCDPEKGQYTEIVTMFPYVEGGGEGGESKAVTLDDGDRHFEDRLRVFKTHIVALDGKPELSLHET